MRERRETVYKLLKLYSFFIAVLFTGGLAAVAAASFCVLILLKQPLPDTAKMMITAAVFSGTIAVSIYFAVLAWKKPDPPGETYSAKQTLLQSGSLLLPLMTAGIWCSWYWDNCVWTALMIPVALLSLAGAWKYPFRYHPANTIIPFCNFVCISGGCCLFLFLSIRGGKPVSYAGNNPRQIPGISTWQKQNFFPSRCSGIKLSGSTRNFEWRCSVTESDFKNFMANTKFNFRKTGDTSGETIYLYERKNADGSGIKLLYTSKTQTFQGSYSHH